VYWLLQLPCSSNHCNSVKISISCKYYRLFVAYDLSIRFIQTRMSYYEQNGKMVKLIQSPMNVVGINCIVLRVKATSQIANCSLNSSFL